MLLTKLRRQNTILIYKYTNLIGIVGIYKCFDKK